MILVFMASPQSILYKCTLSASIIHLLQVHTICNHSQLSTNTFYLYPQSMFNQYSLSAFTIHHLSLYFMCIHNRPFTNTQYPHLLSIFRQRSLPASVTHLPPITLPSGSLVLSPSTPSHQVSPLPLTQFLAISYLILRQEHL